jgi:hypothetical protein
MMDLKILCTSVHYWYILLAVIFKDFMHELEIVMFTIMSHQVLLLAGVILSDCVMVDE